MSTQQRAAGNACPATALSFDPTRLAQRRCWVGAFAALCGLALSPPAFLVEEHSQHQDHAVELAPSMVTGVAQSLPLTIVTNPKEPYQPVPASNGANYLKAIPGFAVIRNGGSDGDPVLHGMFDSRLNILTNSGIMLSACPNRMDAPASYISPETYDKLTVIKGPQAVLQRSGASARAILFEREPERFDELGSRVNTSLLAGSSGHFDKVLDAATGNRLGYLCFTGNHVQSDDYEDGAGNTVPPRWKKWNGDVVVGWTPDEDTLIKLTVDKGDGEARYAGRGTDGSQFKRESLGLRFVKSNVSDVLEKVEAQVYCSYADHIMDSFRLRTPDLSSMMPMPMASQVDRRTLGDRLAATWRWGDFKLVTGVDAMHNEYRARGSKYDMMTDYYTDADQSPWSKDAVFHSYGVFGELTWFAAERDRLVGGLRLDRASVKDHRQTLKSGHMGHAMANPAANDTRADILPNGFVHYEHGLTDSPATLYAGLGRTERFLDYWELLSPKRGPNGSVNALDRIKPEETTQFGFGLQYNGDKLQAWASGYVGVVQDFILFNYREGMMDSSTQATNVDAQIMGGELGASYQFTGNWKTDASLTYAWGKNSSDDRALPQIPPLEARFGLTYERGDWSADSLQRVVAPQNRIVRDQGNVVDKNSDRSAGFGVLSLSGAYRVARSAKLGAGVDNLFDKDYTEHLNKAGDAGFGFSANETVPEPGRTLWTKVGFSF